MTFSVVLLYRIVVVLYTYVFETLVGVWVHENWGTDVITDITGRDGSSGTKAGQCHGNQVLNISQKIKIIFSVLKNARYALQYAALYATVCPLCRFHSTSGSISNSNDVLPFIFLSALCVLGPYLSLPKSDLELSLF